MICEETHKHSGKEVCDNDRLRIDAISKKLVKIFDTNKNGKLEYYEAVSAFCILCKGSVHNKLKYQMAAYSELISEDCDAHDPTNVCIRYKNLKKYMSGVLKIALQSSSEIILDYPIEKLAAATADKCIEYCQVDKSKGHITLEQLNRFVETSNVMAIFSAPE